MVSNPFKPNILFPQLFNTGSTTRLITLAKSDEEHDDAGMTREIRSSVNFFDKPDKK